jgi:hypothetical protein
MYHAKDDYLTILEKIINAPPDNFCNFPVKTLKLLQLTLQHWDELKAATVYQSLF